MRAVFIVGTGRSGTHFSCRAMAGFSNIYDPFHGEESSALLKSIAVSAIQHKALDKKVINHYERAINELPEGKVLLDQHHPNIFFVSQLSNIARDAVFLYPKRPTLQIVASMLKHSTVLAWYDYAKRRNIFGFAKPNIPIPNRFLGVSSKEELFNLDLHKLCTLRVMAHQKKMDWLVANNSSCRFISYEALVKDQFSTFKSVFTKNELDTLGDFAQIERSNSESLDKYKSVLDPQQIKDVLDIEEMWMQEDTQHLELSFNELSSVQVDRTSPF